MTLAEKQTALAARYAIIQDPQERLAAIVARARKVPPLSPDERTESNRITGCQSEAWVVGSCQEGVMHFHGDAESALVKGLVTLVCDFYDGATPAEILHFNDTLFETMGLARWLSGTRQHGMKSLRARLRNLAEACSP